MKKDYTMANGKTVEVEVTAQIGEILVTFKREDDNASRKARWRNEASIEAMNEETGWEPTDTTVDIEADYDEREEKETLAAAVEGLSEQQQRLVRLRYYEEMTVEEIGRFLGVSKQAVSKQLATIHKALKKYFEGDR